ncbi:MAG: diguanylate cyclase [Burkholderiales bacterium]|nr:diguanylate cyclase [Burkholderiales bacterium]
MFTVVLGSFAVYVEMEAQADRSQSQRYESFQLANELWHSSESLTKMARSYIVTGNPRYRTLFHDILDIRDGRKSRTGSNSWDLAVYGEKIPGDGEGAAVPLLELLQKAASGVKEAHLLEVAKEKSDELVKTEILAMRLRDEADPEARRKAREMLFDESYDRAKLSILKPISQFNKSMDARTAAAVKHAVYMASLYRLVFIVVGLVWLYMLWRSYRSLQTLLGASPAALHEQIARLGRGDFSHPPQDMRSGDDSVISWVCQTRRKLSEMTQAREQAEDQLRERSLELERSEAHLQSIIDLSPAPNMLFDPLGNIREVNSAFTRCFGYALEDIPTLDAWRSRAYPDPVYRKWVMETWQERLAQSILHEDLFQPTEIRIVTRDGLVRIVVTEAVSIKDGPFGNVILVVFHDITDLRQAESQLREAKERLEAAASAGIVGIWDWDIGSNKLVWDKVMYRLYGTREEDFSGAYEAWSSALHPDDRKYAEDEIQATLRGEREYAPEFRVIWPDGSIHHLKAMSHTTFDADGKPVRMVGVNYDLTEQKQIQFELDRLAFHDRLTKLPNRRLLEDRLHQSVALAKREHRRLSLLFIDLDRFKEINDELGHEAGDFLLQMAAERMLDCLRSSDTVARLGGDEFVVLLPDIKSIRDASNAAEKIRLSLEKPFAWKDGRVMEISSSIGVAIFPDHADNPQDLLRYGDDAMYRAKKAGRNVVHVFQTADALIGSDEFSGNPGA